jgi:hypothetical protein
MSLPDFTDNEFQLVNQILLERYNRIVPLQAVEVELLLNPDDRMPTPCPALYWSELGAEFVVAKTGDQRFRCQFFYSPSEIFGTGARRLRQPRRLRDHPAQAAGRPSRHAQPPRCPRAARKLRPADARRRKLPAADRHMTLEKARQLLETQVSFGGGYNRNGARLIIADVIREHGQASGRPVDPRHAPGPLFGFRPGETP